MSITKEFIDQNIASLEAQLSKTLGALEAFKFLKEKLKEEEKPVDEPVDA